MISFKACLKKKKKKRTAGFPTTLLPESLNQSFATLTHFHSIVFHLGSPRPAPTPLLRGRGKEEF